MAFSPPPTLELTVAPTLPAVKRKRLRVARTVAAARDLHLRIAAQFVQLASRFESRVLLAKGTHHVDGKSILGVLMLGAAQGTRLRIIATGRDAEPAIAALSTLFDRCPPNA